MLNSRRRCRQCGRLFRPDARARNRQHTCWRRKCQGERHREACAARYRARKQEREVERFRKQIRRKSRTSGGEPSLSSGRLGAAGSASERRTSEEVPAKVSGSAGEVVSGERVFEEFDWRAIQEALGVKVGTVLWEMARSWRASRARLERRLRADSRQTM